MTNRYRLALVGVLVFVVGSAQAEEHGRLNFEADKPRVWSDEHAGLVDYEKFWSEFVSANDGKYWGKRSTYPEYSVVREGDTLLIQIEEDTCLMYFFHQRWRRAQDVWRWDERFNQIAACPIVFD